MATKTTYTCDRCRKEYEDRSQLWYMHVFVSGNPSSRFDAYLGIKHGELKADWCRSCCEEVGIAFREQAKAETYEAPKSLEDIVREMIHQELAQARG